MTADSTPTITLSATEWAAMAALVMQRPWDGRCERCGLRRPVDPHHRLMRSHGGPDVPSNLAALCRVCHDDVHGHPGLAYDQGWLVRSGGDFAAIPLTLHSGAVVVLEDDYGYRFLRWPD